jgi:TIR domain
LAETTTNVQGRIFISYRRQDSAYAAGWLFDRLAERFGPEQIFKDVDSIDFGDDFVEEIGAAVGSTDVLLALIGDRWLAVADEHGARRLDDPEDFVRIEIEAALTRNVRIIPVLVEGATMPAEDQLPPSLAPLARRQALELSPSRFASDTGTLLRALDRAMVEARERDAAASEEVAPATVERPAKTRPSASLRDRIARRRRPLAVTLSLVGAGLGIISNTVERTEELAREAFAPEMLGIPLLAATIAILLQAGRLRERLAYGLLLGFGLLTVAGAIGIWGFSNEIDGGQEQAPLVFLGAGALILTAGLIGTAGVIRAPRAWDAPFRWGPASLLAVAGAMVAVAALFVRLGTLDSLDETRLRDLGGDLGLTGLVVEPIVAIGAACVAVYALGKGGAVRLLASGLALALAAETALFYGSVLIVVEGDYRGYWSSTNPAGFIVGFCAAALFGGAGVLGRRSP